MFRFTIQHLEAFEAVRDHRSFSAAADKLGITQPSISLRIRDLEIALGHRLFERGRGGVRLSEAGRTISDQVRQSLTMLSDIASRLDASDPFTGTLHLGASNTFAQSCLPAVLSELERLHPRLRIEVTVSNSHTLATLLNEGRLDLAFLISSGGSADIVVQPLATTEIDWFASPQLLGHPLKKQDLARQRIMTLPDPSPFHSVIVNWFNQARLGVPSLNTCNDMATMVKLVRSGSAVCILPTAILDEDMATGFRVRPDNAPAIPPLRMSVAYRASLAAPVSALLLEVAAKAVAASTRGLALDPGLTAPRADAGGRTRT